MRICDIQEGSARLSESFDVLTAAWRQAATQWDDPASRRFHRERLEPLGPLVLKALGAMQRLGDVLARVERDCGEE